ncbi:hypothetical protein [Kocuria rosea]|uniref:Uncharacterized protein n=1 Tax=Kocuria rosea TaxID=1275 RepID=A0A4R5YC90_KOCRO|nr:hypothetical protein [Kocuria rosea]TDL42452.1 hypothetical protein E2R59_10935 [Kocuria rosea]
MTPDRTLRRWGLILTGIGAAAVLASLWWLGTSLLGRALAIEAALLYGLGGLLAVSGVIMLVIASLAGRTGPGRRGFRRKPLWSLRPMAVMITVASGSIAIAAGVTSVIMREIDSTHRLAQADGFVLPVGFVAACGLVFVIGDAVLEVPTPPGDQQPADPPSASTHRPVGAMGTALRAYAIYLLLWAVGALALSIYIQAPWSIGLSIFLLASTAVFAWGLRSIPRPAGPSDPWTGMRDELARTAARWAPEPSPRQMSLILTGAGGGIATPTFVLTTHFVYIQEAGTPYDLLFVLSLSLLTTFAGLIIFLDDSLPSHSRRH